jgi:hypothetical protein
VASSSTPPSKVYPPELAEKIPDPRADSALLHHRPLVSANSNDTVSQEHGVECSVNLGDPVSIGIITLTQGSGCVSMVGCLLAPDQLLASLRPSPSLCLTWDGT